MANLAIEQKLNEHGHPGGAQPASAPNYVNLGGFAVSFEDLLQRVGARLEHAFSAADKSGGIPEAAKSAQNNTDHRDYADTRESGNSDDRRRDGDAAEHGRSTASDARDNGTARADEAPRSDNAADNASDRDGHSDRDAQGAADKSEKADNGDNDKAQDDGSNETAADGNNDGKGGEKSADTGDGKAAADGKGNQNAAETAANATQAAAVYAAGLIKGKGQQNVNAAKADPQAQAQKGADITDNAALQAAAGKTAKNGQGNHKLGQSNQQAEAKTAAGTEQKAQGAEQKGQSTTMQNQAQQLARTIGSDSRANINVNVTKEQAPLTSKPTFTVANASVLTADGAAAKNSAQQGQTGQQQGQNLTQQAQLAAQQQAQAAQQANVQNAQQGVQAGTGQGGTTTATSAVQTSGGGAQHAGGESLNNTTQTANTGQQTQQTQQTRESQPQQQAQQAQRTNLPGSAVTEQISVKITKALQTGTDRISIQLKPAELGRVDVKLEMTHDGRVMTVVTAEKQDTLDMLRRDSSELQKALADAGLQSGDMEFNLQGQEQQNAEAEGDGTPGSDNADAEAAENGETDVNDGVMSAWESGIFANGRLDMRA